jgi:hypothetical protein
MATIGALLSGSLNGGGEKEKVAAGSVDGVPSAPSSTSGSGGFHLVTEELLRKGIESLEDPEQKARILK